MLASAHQQSQRWLDFLVTAADAALREIPWLCLLAAPKRGGMTTLPRPALVGLQRRVRRRLPALGPRRLPRPVAWGLAGSIAAGLGVATILYGRGAPPREV